MKQQRAPGRKLLLSVSHHRAHCRYETACVRRFCDVCAVSLRSSWLICHRLNDGAWLVIVGRVALLSRADSTSPAPPPLLHSTRRARCWSIHHHSWVLRSAKRTFHFPSAATKLLTAAGPPTSSLLSLRGGIFLRVAASWPSDVFARCNRRQDGEHWQWHCEYVTFCCASFEPRRLFASSFFSFFSSTCPFICNTRYSPLGGSCSVLYSTCGL
jgi:hypothetical protein